LDALHKRISAGASFFPHPKWHAPR
jgi:hypothetical protein